jgi:hypothetical protein
MKDIIKLLEEVSPKLDTYDARFMSKLETMLAILRTSGIISSTRTARYGRWHQLLAGALVLAYDEQEDLFVSTRSAGKLHAAGITTRLTQWLDALCEREYLITQSPSKKAEGRLSLSDFLSLYLADRKVDA